MQKLLTLIVAAAIIYQVMMVKLDEHTSKTSVAESKTQDIGQETTPVPLEGGFLERSLSKVLINVLKTPEGRTFFENMIQPVNAPLTGENTGFAFDSTKLIENMFRVQTIGDGVIGPASCGHRVTIDYIITTMDNIIVDEGSKTFQLGSGTMILALENIVVGMYVGQTREGIAAAKYAYDNPKFRGPNKTPSVNYKVKVTLQDIMPEVYMSSKDIRIFDDKMAYQLPYLCGEFVTFDVRITSLDGKIIYDTESLQQQVSMTLGDMSYPMVFSHALFNKIPIGTRAVIAQGKYLRSFGNKNANKIFIKEQLPADELFLIEFRHFSQDRR